MRNVQQGLIWVFPLNLAQIIKQPSPICLNILSLETRNKHLLVSIKPWHRVYEEIGSIRKGQKQVLEEQWKKIEENSLNHQKEDTVKINKQDIVSVNDIIEKKIKEKDVEERARKD